VRVALHGVHVGLAAQILTVANVDVARSAEGRQSEANGADTEAGAPERSQLTVLAHVLPTVPINSPTFRVYVNADPAGVELAAAAKNVIALAAGAMDGLRLGPRPYLLDMNASRGFPSHPPTAPRRRAPS
jgi:hypothetical protein